jgi:hypothetical protein
MFKAQDMKDVKMRVETMWPPTKLLPALLVVDFLPMACLNLINKFPLGAWKVEWMFNGSYEVHKNDLYKQRYLMMGKRGKEIYSKLWDGMGFAKFDMAYKMWLETLFRPGQIIRYEGNAFLLDQNIVKPQVARMITHVYDFDHIVTVSVITL